MSRNTYSNDRVGILGVKFLRAAGPAAYCIRNAEREYGWFQEFLRLIPSEFRLKSIEQEFGDKRPGLLTRTKRDANAFSHAQCGSGDGDANVGRVVQM